MFEQLFEMVTLLFELAPLMLILFLFLAIMKAFESKMGMTYLLVGILLTSGMLLVPNTEAENLQNFYSDSKGFNYLDVCNLYPVFNSTDDRQISDITDDYEVISSYEGVVGGTALIPHKTISFSQAYPTDAILLMTKIVYNWSIDTEIRLSLYYEDVGNTSTTLVFFYQDYMSEVLTDNVTNDYKYINGGLKDFSYTSTQAVFQRSTNIVNTADGTNIFNSYDKKYGVSNTLTSLSSQNITVYRTQSIKTNQWVTITLKKEGFLWNGSLFNSHNFMNFGLIKVHHNHGLLINDYQVSNKNVRNKNTAYPFREFYEFKEITDNTTDRIIFHMDLISINYQQLTAHALEFGIYSGKLRLMIDGSSVWNGSELYVDNDVDSTYFHFTGYQFNLQMDDNGDYHIYLFYKWNFNQMMPVSDEINYNYSFKSWHLIGEDIAYLHNFEYYDDTNNTDMQISYTQYTHKWDVIDSEIRKIDVALGHPVTLIHDVDSGGFKIPSISDLKKAFTEKIVKPVTSTLNVVKSDILKPLNTVINSLTSITSQITSIGGQITSTISAVNSGFSGMTTTVTSLFSGLETALTNSLTAIQTAVGTVDTSINSIIGYVDGVETAIANVITAVGDAVGKVQEVVDMLAIGGDLWTLFDAIKSSLFVIYNGLLVILEFTFDFMADAIPFILQHAPLILTYLEDTINIMSIYLGMVGMLLGVVIIYRVVLGLYLYTETGELVHLWAIFDALEAAAKLIWGFFVLLLQFIAGIIP